MKKLLLLLLPLGLVPAWAGERFFDDFDGEDLGPHWSFGNPKGGMIYSVHDSLLEVYGFTGFFGNREWISARLPHYDDFNLEAIVGWTDGPQNRESLTVALDIALPRAPAITFMAFDRRLVAGKTTNTVRAQFLDGPDVEVEAPSSGLHSFRLSRSAGVFSAYFNDELILRGGGTAMRPRRITLFFSGTHSLPVHLFVDSVSVVPEPASVLASAAGIGWFMVRRRRRTC